MSNFITLTQWHRYQPTNPVLVNLDNVTYMFSHTTNLPTRTPSPAFPKPPEAGAYTVTVICFTAGLHEEADSIFVTESLAEIENLF